MTLLNLGRMGATEVFIIMLLIALIVVLPIVLGIRNQKLKTQNKFLQKDSLNLDLHKLAELKDKGLITEEEYRLKKEEILKRM